MAVTARFTYRIRHGGMAAFVEKLKAAADPQFDSPVMPEGIRFQKMALPGPDSDIVIMDIDYPDLAAFGARTDYEQTHPAWTSLWQPRDDAPEELVGMQLLRPFHPFD
ncbi:MAG: hypothetical protein NVV60_01675 [Luteimonas sp.]|nr:hypothetical protein [Luteimonas sp.]